MMNIIYVKDVKGLHHRFDRFTSYVDDGGFMYATYVDRDGSAKTVAIDIFDWQDAEVQAAPVVACSPGY